MIEVFMRVLFINSVCGIRSTGRIVTDLAEAYMSQGHECRIAYGREISSEKYESISYKIGTELQVRSNALRARILDNEGLNAWSETKKFIEWANHYNPDVLWLHNLHGYYIHIELLFKWIKSRPNMEVKWTLHDCWAFTGHCAHFSYIGCDKWKTCCEKCPQKKEYPKGMIFDNSKRNYLIKKELFSGIKNLTIITPSFWLADLVKESFLKEYPVKVIHNEIDRDVFKPSLSNFRQKYGLEGKFIVLGVASAWTEKKGLNDFVLLSNMLDKVYRIVLVGLDPKQIAAMPESILCVEMINSKKELAEIYTAADVFLNLTYEDTYPTVNLEAQACGTPCITYKTGGSVESVDKENVVEQGDLLAIVHKLNDMKEC